MDTPSAPKSYLDIFIAECTAGIITAIREGREHHAARYTISLVRAMREKGKFNQLKLVKDESVIKAHISAAKSGLWRQG